MCHDPPASPSCLLRFLLLFLNRMPRTACRYEFGPYLLDAAEHRLLRKGAEVLLRPKAFETLCLLVENAGRLLKKEDLLKQVWPDTAVEQNNLDKNISLLRKALGAHAAGNSYIETVPRLGYRFVAPVIKIGAPAGPERGTGQRLGPLPRQEIRFCSASDGVRLAYATAGSGYPLVKAANWLNHLDYEWNSPIWKHWIGKLTKHHRVIRYDERGNGLSDWQVKDMSVEVWVRDLEAVVDAAGVDRFALMGISQGGAVAISYAVRHPERVSHLILHGVYSRGFNHRANAGEMEGRRAFATLMRLNWGKNLPGFSEMFTRRFIPDDSAREHQIWFENLQRVSASPENAARIMEACDEINVRSLLPCVSVPTIVFQCDRDGVVPVEEGRILAAEIPNARYIPLNSSNHLLLAEEPAWGVFIDELGTFLNWQDADAASN